MKIALLQLNPTVGDFAGNLSRLVQACEEARAAGATLCVAPELYLCGYPPLDLLNLESFRAAADRALLDAAAQLAHALPVFVGTIARNPSAATRGGKALQNAVALIEDGTARIVATKTLLPTYDVFDEHRYFEPCTDPSANVVEVCGTRFGVTICEDIWNDRAYWPSRLYATDPVEALAAAGCQVILNLSASPYAEGKGHERFRMIAATARRHGLPVVYANQVGAQTGVIFDGRSFAVSPLGDPDDPPQLWNETIAFAEAVTVVDLRADPAHTPPRTEEAPELAAALTLGIRDYFGKIGFGGAVVGLSGGIDSSIVATLAARALGPENVVGISMPSRYSSEHSKTDAYELGRNLGIEVHTVSIEPMFAAYRASLAPVFFGKAEDVTEENLQARIRGAILMAFSNKHGHLVLTTGNKSECSVGFSTLYGDTCGGLGVIADLWKTEVYAVSRWLNKDAGRTLIPEQVLTKPPSPELRPDQLDSHALPPYEEVLDPLMQALVEDELTPTQAAARVGCDVALAERFQRNLFLTEYKRFQFPPTLRVSRRAWVGRRFPIVHRYFPAREG